MKTLLCIPYVNRLDMLQTAISSIADIRDDVDLVVINNSDATLLEETVYGAAVVTPSVPLTFTQTMNLMIDLARPYDVLMFMHNDGEAVDGSARSFYSFVFDQWNQHGDANWGVIFSCYDVLCAFNVEALQIVGKWDTAFMQYWSDVDYYRRVRLEGFVTLESGLGDKVIHHNNSSNTKKSDPLYAVIVNAFDPTFRAYYEGKWGGRKDKEQYRVPFDGHIRRTWIAGIRQTRLFQELSKVSTSTEGNLLELTDANTCTIQVETIAKYLRPATRRCYNQWEGSITAESRPLLRVVETGTNKGMFGLLLHSLIPHQFHLTTYGDEQASAEAVRLLAADGVQAQFVHGNSVETFTKDNDPYDFAWIDGGHDYDVAVSDLQHAMELGIPYILVDDAKLHSVDAAISTALNSHPTYRRTQNPLWDLDPRGIAILLKHSTQSTASQGE